MFAKNIIPSVLMNAVQGSYILISEILLFNQNNWNTRHCVLHDQAYKHAVVSSHFDVLLNIYGNYVFEFVSVLIAIAYVMFVLQLD